MVNLSLSTPGRNVEGVEVQTHLLLTSALGAGKWSTSRPGRFIPGSKRQYPLSMRLGGPQSRYGRFQKREKFLAPDGNELRSVQSTILE